MLITFAEYVSMLFIGRLLYGFSSGAFGLLVPSYTSETGQSSSSSSSPSPVSDTAEDALQSDQPLPALPGGLQPPVPRQPRAATASK